MKKACIIISALTCILIIVTLFVQGNSFPSQKYHGVLYRSEYMIPAVLTDETGVFWYSHFGKNGKFKKISTPMQVYIADLKGDECIIMNKDDIPFSDITFADNVPLSSLQYDEAEVEKARKKKNRFQYDCYSESEVIVFHGEKDHKTYRYKDSKGYPFASLLGKQKYTTNNLFFKELILFAGTNALFVGIISYLYFRKRSATPQYIMLMILNGIMALVPIIYLAWDHIGMIYLYTIYYL